MNAGLQVDRVDGAVRVVAEPAVYAQLVHAWRITEPTPAPGRVVATYEGALVLHLDADEASRLADAWETAFSSDGHIGDDRPLFLIEGGELRLEAFLTREQVPAPAYVPVLLVPPAVQP